MSAHPEDCATPEAPVADNDADAEDLEEAQRWLDWLGHVELPDPGRTTPPSFQLPAGSEWEGWQGYIEQRLAYCP